MNKESFFKISYGLYIVTSRKGTQYNGYISNTVIQVSSDPPLLAVCSHKNNLTTEYIDESKVMGITVIKEKTDMPFIGKFGFKSGREFDKFNGTKFKLGVTGAPIVLDQALAYFDCEVLSVVDVGTHKIFIVKIIDAEILDNDSSPLTYKYYREVIKGVSPKNAPTYKDPQEIKNVTENKKLQKWHCEICGHIYDPEYGDPEHGIAPGTSFVDLPEGWTCPVCGVDKSNFVPI